MPEPTWTTERIERLKNRFEAGLSCRQIADDIGVSRNAVIGKLSRLNLTREENGDARRPTRKDAARERRPRAGPRTVPRLQYQMLKALYGEPQPAVGEPVHNGHPASLLQLAAQLAPWPIRTPHPHTSFFTPNTT